MAALLIGYALCSTDQQDLTAQRDGLLGLGVDPAPVYVNHGPTGTDRDRPGLREALAACRDGDTLVVTKLDRLARSLPDARAIADELTARQVRLNLGGSVYDPNDAVGRLLFNVLAMVAESHLIRLRTKEGMKVAKAKGRLRGKRSKLNPGQEAHLVSLFEAGEHSTAELADLFGFGRSTSTEPSNAAGAARPERTKCRLPQHASPAGGTRMPRSRLPQRAASGSSTGHSTRRPRPDGRPQTRRYLCRVLRRFIYLDRTALDQYVTALEGGRTTESTTRLVRTGTGAGGFDAKLVSASGEKSREEEESRTLADTDEARFDRLLRAAASQPEALGWTEVMQPDTDLAGIGLGAMLAWECDLYIPEIVQALAQSGEALGAIGMMQNLLPMARRLGLDTEGLPNDEEMGAVSGFIGGMDASLLVVGEDDETDWRVAGQLNDASLHGDVEGRARVIGKVSKVVPLGRWKPYLTFPGMNLLPREQRRRMERQAPAAGKENEYLAGPALMLDILAIYR